MTSPAAKPSAADAVIPLTKTAESIMMIARSRESIFFIGVVSFFYMFYKTYYSTSIVLENTIFFYWII